MNTERYGQSDIQDNLCYMYAFTKWTMITVDDFGQSSKHQFPSGQTKSTSEISLGSQINRLFHVVILQLKLILGGVRTSFARYADKNSAQTFNMIRVSNCAKHK